MIKDITYLAISELLRWKVALVLGSLGYLLCASLLRHQRANSLLKRFGPTDGLSLGQMTMNDAQAILKELTELEFPKIFGFSIIFALFKTYGIPSVSSLLVTTGQLADLKSASKRIADTGVILLEFALNAPTSERATNAIVRMNYIHSAYIKVGKISNNDLLFTLSLFALEPARWVDRYEWRSLTDLELCACGTYWKSMGDAMEISYASLPSSSKGWENGLTWLKEIEEWSRAYEMAHMVPATTNKQLADAEFDVICINVPKRLLGICRRMLSVLLGERLRQAMMYPKPSPIYCNIVLGGLNVRKFVLRYLALPRPEWRRKQFIPAAPNPGTGRYNSLEYLSFPWYVRPTLWSRWGPKSWMTRLLGRKLPGDDGNIYAPEGWTHSELGPRALRNKGLKEMDENRAQFLAQGRGGCPFR